jgi:hypothetical protein
MYSEVANCSHVLEMFIKGFACEFSAMVSAKDFDLCPTLNFNPGLVLLIVIKPFRFLLIEEYPFLMT